MRMMMMMRMMMTMTMLMMIMMMMIIASPTRKLKATNTRLCRARVGGGSAGRQTMA
jgi:hypothetical protein